MSELSPEPLFPPAEIEGGIRAWLVVACADHVARGQREGFIQACHGKPGPLRRMRPGDIAICYSPTQRFQSGDGLRAFTAFGILESGDPYLHDMGGGFVPWRRDVRWLQAMVTPLESVKERLALTQDPHWGWKLRQGHVPLALKDAQTLAEAMLRKDQCLNLSVMGSGGGLSAEICCAQDS